VLWDAIAEARAWRESAEAEARAVIERAGQEADAIREVAAGRGREEGLASVTEIHARALLERDRLLDRAREELIELAFGIAERVIGDVVRSRPDLVVELAARVIEGSRGRVELTIHAHPSDLPSLREAKPRLLSRSGGTPRIRLAPCEGLARGGVVVETELGRVEASIEGQLAALRRVASGSPEGAG
jgi:flagellar biosynthesis/type III secretory pathway protein FliH